MRPLPILALSVLACGKVTDPTKAGAVLVEWDRSSATQYAGEAPPTRHPLADAKILEGPQKKTFRVTAEGFEGKGYAFDVAIESAKVSFPADGKETTRWATVKVGITLVENDAYRITAKCDDQVGFVLGAPGDPTNTMMDCQVVAKRPNTMGDEDAITVAAFIQIEGSGKIPSNDPKLKIEER